MVSKYDIHPDLKSLMDVIGFQKLNTPEELSEIFNVSNLDKDGTPKIVTQKKTVIVFDNSDFNSTYIIDMVNDYLENMIPKHERIKYNFIYIDNPIIRRDLFHPDLRDSKEPKMNNAQYLELNILKAGIMVINPVKQHIVTFMESNINTLESNVINGGLNWLWSEDPDIKVLGLDINSNSILTGETKL